MKKLKNSLSVVFFAGGLFLLFLLVRKVGYADIRATFDRLGIFHLSCILALPVTWTFLQAIAWHRVLHDKHGHTSLGHVFLAKICGEAVNTITPLGLVGGDPYRVYFLQKTASSTASAASVVIDRTLHTLAIFILLALTFILAWIYIPLPDEWRWLMPLVIVFFFALIFFLINSQKKGIFLGLSALLKKAGLFRKKLPQWDHKLKELDHEIGAFYRKSRLHFFEVLTLHFISRLLGALEIWLIAVYLGFPITALQSLFLASLTILINIAFAFIPGSLGVMEGGYGALFYLLKLDPSYGIALQLVRRIRTFFWIFLGLVIMFAYQPAKRKPL